MECTRFFGITAILSGSLLLNACNESGSNILQDITGNQTSTQSVPDSKDVLSPSGTSTSQQTPTPSIGEATPTPTPTVTSNPSPTVTSNPSPTPTGGTRRYPRRWPWPTWPTGTPRPSPTITSTPSPIPSPVPTPIPTPRPTPTPTSSTGPIYIGPAEVEKYVSKFVDDGQIQGINVNPKMQNPTLVIQLSSLSSYGSSVIGLCERGTSLRRVTLDPTFWSRSDETQRELLVHHELGHCVLLRAHRNDLLSTGLYASIMYPIIMSNRTYQDNYAYYLNELFTWSGLETGEDPNKDHIDICDYSEIIPSD